MTDEATPILPPAEIARVEVRHDPDPEPDLSYLTPRPVWSHDQRAWAIARAEAWERGEWTPVVVRAHALVTIPVGSQGEYVEYVELDVASGGVRNVESDLAEDRMRVLENREREVLTTMLAQLGFEVSRLDWNAKEEQRVR